MGLLSPFGRYFMQYCCVEIFRQSSLAGVMKISALQPARKSTPESNKWQTL
jgi:hypothetical protein